MTTITLTPQKKRILRQQFADLSMKEKYQIYDIKKIGYLDIECTNLKGDYGELLSWAMDVRDVETGKSKMYHSVIKESDILQERRKRETGFDKRIIIELLTMIKKLKVDMLIGQYFHGWGKMDVPFIRTRAFMLKIDKLLPGYKQIKYGDCWKMYHMSHNASSFRLDNIAEIAGVRTHKTRIKKKEWALAAMGEKKALTYVLDHNLKDAHITRLVHQRVERFHNIPAGYI